MNDYEAKQQAKRERHAERAEKLRAEAERKHRAASERASHIPMGQPILVGHHSEKRHRSDIARIDRDTSAAMEASRKADYHARKAESLGTGGISSDDPDAIAKLTEKLRKLELKREDIKRANTKARKEGRPTFEPYVLQNLGGNIRQVRDRIKTLTAAAALAPAPAIEGDGFTVEECLDDNRIRFIFDDKPSADVRDILKRNGFRWSPTAGAWQRQLSQPGRYAAEYCRTKIAELAG